jgi:predicted transcriptional regulator
VTSDEQAAIRGELHKALQAAGVRQEDVAAALGHSQAYIAQQLRGERPLKAEVVSTALVLLAQRATATRAAQMAEGHLLVRSG